MHLHIPSTLNTIDNSNIPPNQSVLVFSICIRPTQMTPSFQIFMTELCIGIHVEEVIICTYGRQAEQSENEYCVSTETSN